MIGLFSGLAEFTICAVATHIMSSAQTQSFAISDMNDRDGIKSVEPLSLVFMDFWLVKLKRFSAGSLRAIL